MTETAHLITSNFLPPGIRKTASVGKGRGVEVRIFKEDGTRALTMSPGEVCVRGENVFKGT
jgi:acyl-CoA synthetase (AMP-forming)/AMP-acid ligase II